MEFEDVMVGFVRVWGSTVRAIVPGATANYLLPITEQGSRGNYKWDLRSSLRGNAKVELLRK